MRPRPLAASAAAVLVAGAVAAPALAAGRSAVAAPAPAAGAASSTLTLLSLLAASHDVQVGGVTLSTDALSGTPSSGVAVVPLKVDGTSYGAQSVTPGNSPQSIGSYAAPSALAGLVSASSPAIRVSAQPDSAKAGTSSLGSLSLLGLPVALEGGMDAGSSIGSNTGALGAKTVTLRNVKLPSIAALLGADGLDVAKLPAGTLTSLVDKLGIVSGAITTAESALSAATAGVQAQIDAANTQVTTAATTAASTAATLASKNAAFDSAATALTSATAGATAADSALAAANAALSTATSALNGKLSALPAPVLATLPVGAGTIAGYTALSGAQRQAVETAVPGTAAAFSSYSAAAGSQTSAAAAQAAAATQLATATAAKTAAQAAATVAKTAADAAAAALDAAKTSLALVVGGLAPQVSAVVNAVVAALGATPLLSLDELVVQTEAAVTSAAPGGQTASVVGGRLSGLKVLGTDVLSKALGGSSVNAVDLTGSTLGKVQSQIAGLTGTLSSVLSTVPSLPSLAIPAPRVDLLTKTTSTGTSGGFGTASAAVQALGITLPPVTIPAAVALPGAPTLPAISGLPAVPPLPSNAVTDLVSKQLSLGFGTVSEQARFKPAVVGAPTGTGPQTTPGTGTPGTVTPGTGTPGQLPATGVGAGVGLAAVALVGTALVLRRRVTAG